MLLLSLALHGWLLWAEPAPAIQVPSGRVALSLGQLQLSSAAPPTKAAESEGTEPEKAPSPPQPPKPKVLKKEKPQSKTPVGQSVLARREPVKTGRADNAIGKESEEVPTDTAVPKATVAEIGAGDEPVLVDRPAFASPPSPPLYPRLARQRRQQGTVVIEIQLGRNGEQVARQLLQSSGVDSLDNAALAAVKDWQFLPYRENGRPRQSRVQLPIRFAL